MIGLRCGGDFANFHRAVLAWEYVIASIEHFLIAYLVAYLGRDDFGFCYSLWIEIVRSTKRSFCVVIQLLILNENAGYSYFNEAFSIQIFIGEMAVGTLNIAVILMTARLDVECFIRFFTEPSLNFAGNKLGGIIVTEVLENTV